MKRGMVPANEALCGSQVLESQGSGPRSVSSPEGGSPHGLTSSPVGRWCLSSQMEGQRAVHSAMRSPGGLHYSSSRPLCAVQRYPLCACLEPHCPCPSPSWAALGHAAVHSHASSYCHVSRIQRSSPSPSDSDRQRGAIRGRTGRTSGRTERRDGDIEEKKINEGCWAHYCCSGYLDVGMVKGYHIKEKSSAPTSVLRVL